MLIHLLPQGLHLAHHVQVLGQALVISTEVMTFVMIVSKRDF